MKTANRIVKSLCRPRTRVAIQFAGIGLLGCLVAVAAVVTKEAVHRTGLDPLVAMGSDDRLEPAAVVHAASHETTDAPVVRDPLVIAANLDVVEPAVEIAVIDEAPKFASAETRYFNGRPVRPAKTIRMTVTAYSPDEHSCAGSADGITSSNHSVWSNAMKMVAADSKVLPLGSIITVPGYDEGRVVPVLDRGGAIKGNRLDVLYATHEQARKWGVQKIDVVVWEYADGLPADDYRVIRDSRN